MSYTWLKFWWWIKEFVDKQRQKWWLSGMYVNLKCENCKLWMHQSCRLSEDVVIRHLTREGEDYSWGYSWTCKQCDHTSYWNCEAFPFPARADENGNIKED